MIRNLVPLALLAVLAGCTQTPEQQAASAARSESEFAEAIGDRVAGEPQRCIDPSQIDGPQIIAPDTIIYRENAGKLWVAKVDGCPPLRPLDTLIVDLYGSNQCQNDRFRTITPGVSIPSAYCRFGMFTPYEKPRD